MDHKTIFILSLYSQINSQVYSAYIVLIEEIGRIIPVSPPIVNKNTNPAPLDLLAYTQIIWKFTKAYLQVTKHNQKYAWKEYIKSQTLPVLTLGNCQSEECPINIFITAYIQ